MVSHCITYAAREDYAKTLEKFTNLTVIGTCNDKMIPFGWTLANSLIGKNIIRCFVFQPANGCFTHGQQVIIIFFSVFRCYTIFFHQKREKTPQKVIYIIPWHGRGNTESKTPKTRSIHCKFNLFTVAFTRTRQSIYLIWLCFSVTQTILRILSVRLNCLTLLQTCSVVHICHRIPI